MKTAILFAISVTLVSVPAALAQKWEFGGGVGGSFYTSQTITAGQLSGAAKFDNGFGVSVWLDNNGKGHIGGELRYDFLSGDERIDSGGVHAGFGAQTHAIHYDFLYHFTKAGSSIRPFVAAGGGVKSFRGTGTEKALQPLSNIALLSKTSETVGLLSLGGGVKVKIAPGFGLRLEVHDYLTPFPKNVIVPASGKVSGWLQNFVPSAGLSFLF